VSELYVPSTLRAVCRRVWLWRVNANLDHFLALLILACMIIAMYLAMEEISRAMGEGALTRLFFKRPDPA